MTRSGLDFRLLGPLTLIAGGTPLPAGTPKQRALLAIMLINRNRIVGTDSLVNALWGEEALSAARASIHTYISNVRRLLLNAGVNSQSVLIAASPGYRLVVPNGDCDLDRFITNKTAGIDAAAAGRFEEARAHLSAALAEWRGSALHDLQDFDFAQMFATALAEDRALVQTTRAAAEIACGRSEAIIGELEALVIDHPYREPLWTQLITAYYVSDRQRDALAAYRRLKTALAEDLGIDPGRTVRELHEKILRQVPLLPKQSAQATAFRAHQTSRGTSDQRSGPAALRTDSGRGYPLRKTVTRIGRLTDNDIVLDDVEVSRHHALIVDTGDSFVITDLGSTNGVYVQGARIRPSAALCNGDHITICDYQFTFEVQPS